MRNKKTSLAERSAGTGKRPAEPNSSPKPTKRTAREPFKQIMFLSGDLIADVDSARELFHTVIPILDAEDDTQSKLLKEVSARAKEIKAHQRKISVDELTQITNDLRAFVDTFGRSNKLFRSNSVITLVSEYDDFFLHLLKEVLSLHPDRLRGSDKKISYGDAVQLSSLDDLKSKFIDDEVDAVMRESHDEQFRYLEKLLNTDKLRDELGTWSKLVEVIERRNVCVHAGGLISRQYLSVCKQHGVDLGNRKEGDRLKIDIDYYDEACDTVIETAIKSAQTVSRKLLPKDLASADTALILTGLKFMTKERWAIALRLFDYAVQLPAKYVSDDANHKIFLINKCIALKALGKREAALDTLKTVDWSATEDKFRLAVHVIRDEYSAAEKVMCKVGKSKGIGEMEFRDWPLFRDFRGTGEFRRAFRKVFRKDYSVSAANAAQEQLEEVKEELEKNR
jgi:hypothetical protein